MGNDPPGVFTRLLHPRTGRHGPLPDGIIPVGRSVVVPANGSLPNIVLSPRADHADPRACSREEQFDVVHLHEPMTPAICVAALSFAQCPIVVTHHAHGDLGWMRGGLHFWGFLMDRVDARIAVSPMAAESAARWLPGDYRVIPNGVLDPRARRPGRPRPHGRLHRPARPRARGCRRCCARGPTIHAATGARLRADRHRPAAVPPAARAPARSTRRASTCSGSSRTRCGRASSQRAKLSVTPALGGESFGLVLAEAFACATPSVASDIPGYAAVATPEAATPRAAGRRRPRSQTR